MAVVNTGLLEAGLRSDFFNRLSAVPAIWPRFCTVVPSSLPSEKYRWLGSTPAMRQWVGPRQNQGLRSESYDVENLEYEASIEVQGNELDDDQTGQIRVRINEMADRAATFKDYLLAQLLENGGAAGYVAYDGLTYFNDAHVSGASGDQDNNLTGPAATDTTPTTAEMKSAIASCLAALRGFKDDRGYPLNLVQTGAVIMVPPVQEMAAREAVGAAIIAQTSNIMQGAADVVVNPYLATAANMYVMLTGGTIKPFVLQQRRPLAFRSVAENDERAAFNRRYQYGVDERFRMTYGAWYACVRWVWT